MTKPFGASLQTNTVPDFDGISNHENQMEHITLHGMIPDHKQTVTLQDFDLFTENSRQKEAGSPKLEQLRITGDNFRGKTTSPIRKAVIQDDLHNDEIPVKTIRVHIPGVNDRGNKTNGFEVFGRSPVQWDSHKFSLKNRRKNVKIGTDSPDFDVQEFQKFSNISPIKSQFSGAKTIGSGWARTKQKPSANDCTSNSGTFSLVKNSLKNSVNDSVNNSLHNSGKFVGIRNGNPNN